MDTVSWVNLFHHIFFAILQHKNEQQCTHQRSDECFNSVATLSFTDILDKSLDSHLNLLNAPDLDVFVIKKATFTVHSHIPLVR